MGRIDFACRGQEPASFCCEDMLRGKVAKMTLTMKKTSRLNPSIATLLEDAFSQA